MIKVGCCGYPVGRKRYQEIFSLVEINRTFYEIPKISTIAKWRREAPENFEFTVKAHQSISHEHKLRPVETMETFETMKEICRELEAKILLIQTPASFKPENLKTAEEFFRGIKRDDLIIVWETRGPLWEKEEIREELRMILESLDVPHVTDPFRTLPVYSGKVAYLRLHGLGSRMYYYQYSDEELLNLRDIAGSLETKEREVYVLFNNLSMFEDAYRFQSFIKTGEFPPLSLRGSESIRNLLGRIRYPVKKSDLMRRIGWRLIEIEGKQIRIEELLKGIPSKTYKNTDEILGEIEI